MNRLIQKSTTLMTILTQWESVFYILFITSSLCIHFGIIELKMLLGTIVIILLVIIALRKNIIKHY